MIIGLVKWFDPDKGFGVIGTPDLGEFFLHINSFLRKPENISKGTAIIFSKKIDKVKNRNTAENSRFVGELEDWKTILSYLGKPDNVSIEVEVTGRGRRGNTYHRKEIQSFSLIELSTKQYCKEKSEEELTTIVVDYFDNDLDAKYFIPYCELIDQRLTNHFLIEKSSDILNKVFSHFGENLNEEILFRVWKQKKFKFISYTDNDDYEIPESIFKSYVSEIGQTELRRIQNFSFGSEFCSQFVKIKFSKIEQLTSVEINELYSLLEFENESERETIKSQLDSLNAQLIATELTDQANKLDTINNNEDFNNYNRLLQLVPNHFDDENKIKIKNAICEIIASKCSEEFKPELWIKGIIKEAPVEYISKTFLNKDTQTERRIAILTKLEADKQFELLKKYSVEYDFEKAFTLIEGLVKKENSLGYYFNLLEVLFNTEFWKDKKSNHLINLYIRNIDSESSEELKYELFFKGYIKDVPQKLAYQNISKLEKDDCRKIFKSLPENKTFIEEILKGKVTKENIFDFDWLYGFAIQFLDNERFNSFDTTVFETIEQSEYFKHWKIGKAKLFPENYIGEILKDKFENYSQIKTWINNKATTYKEIINFLFSYLNCRVPVTDRVIFYKQSNHIKFLLQIEETITKQTSNNNFEYLPIELEIEAPNDNSHIDFDTELHLKKIKQLNNDFYNIILWFYDKEKVLNFELLKQKFIYFTPDDQVRIIRKLFLLKAKGEFDLTVEKLNELTRFDLDLYKTNLNFNPEIPIDVSTDVVIKALLSYKENQRFFVESELLTVILNDLKQDQTIRFKLSNYFENCLGRQTVKFDWSREGEIKKVNFGNNQFYFAISFSTGETKWVNYRRGGREVYTHNPNFENLKETVKKLHGVKWNPNEKHWGVPSQYETEVLNFAKEQRFFLDFEGSNYVNNIHLAEFKREDIPNGVSFCEGRLANRPHEMFKKEFWWCSGQPCFNKCETIHLKEEWENYTLLDFCEILGFNTDETNRLGDHIPKGHYYQFIALINRFNRLLEKLYCRDCNHILFPVDTSHFAAHTVVRFHCINESCSNNDEIYLNHCLNGQCNCIIDSRVSKRCDNGLFICDNCGSCCSHEMLKRRLESLETTGGYIHDNLRRCVNEKLGHLERAEYFCYKCKAEMTEVSNDIFHCLNCNVKYDTTKYKFKRPHINLKQTRSATGKNGNNSINEGYDIPY